MLLRDIIENGARDHSERAALYFRDQTMTCGELAENVRRLASGMAQAGVGPGDRVGVLLPNSPAFVLAYYAAARLGAVCVPVNPLWKAQEQRHVWSDAAVKMVITAPSLLPGVQEAVA